MMNEYESVDYIKSQKGNCKISCYRGNCFFWMNALKGKKDCYLDHMIYKKYENRDIEFSLLIEKLWIAENYNKVKVERLLEILK